MPNIFALILCIATLLTGLLWCFKKFFFARKKFCYRNTNKSNFKIKKTIIIPEWIDILSSMFPTLILVLIVRSFIFEPFQIPSGSMMPTLLIGDFILVDKFIYGMKDPLYHKTLIKTGHPRRGDIVVFKYPDDPSLDYIKRVVGIPGDKVIYDPIAKEVSVYPSSYRTDHYKNSLVITYSDSQESDFLQFFENYNGWETSVGFIKSSEERTKENSIRLMERKEKIGNIQHRILTLPILQDQIETYYKQKSQKIATWIVPKGQYFMMGDNRDNSADSRYWGFVPEKNLVGKARLIWMSLEKQEGKWPTGVRLNRIGKIY